MADLRKHHFRLGFTSHDAPSEYKHHYTKKLSEKYNHRALKAKLDEAKKNLSKHNFKLGTDLLGYETKYTDDYIKKSSDVMNSKK